MKAKTKYTSHLYKRLFDTFLEFLLVNRDIWIGLGHFVLLASTKNTSMIQSREDWLFAGALFALLR